MPLVSPVSGVPWAAAHPSQFDLPMVVVPMWPLFLLVPLISLCEAVPAAASAPT
jgi:hypothetical protein